MGPSGSGKSTLLNIIGGIDNADEGYVSINGEKTADMTEKKLTIYRRDHLGYVFQMYNLIPNLTVQENIEVGAYLSKKPLDVNELLKTLGLYEHRHKLPTQLSGGQQQRTAIGRAVIKNPDILLCDEPTGALDYNTSKEILALLERVNKEYGNTIKQEIPEGKVLLSNGFMEKYGYKVGDTVSLYDKYADKTYDFTVAGDYPYEATLSIFMNINEFNTTFGKTPDYYSGYFSDAELSSLDDANIYMVLDSAEFSGFADQLWASFADLMEPVKWFGVIMFVLMVFLLAKQIIERNAVSISMTKILGFTGGEIGGLYIAATSIIVVLGLLLAVPAVDRLMRLIFKHFLYKRMSGYLPYAISSDCYVKMVIIGLVSYLIVAALQLFKIHRIPKANALKTLE